jgi:inosose dehydratase
MRFAINPLQWAATGDGTLDWSRAPPDRELMSILASIGFKAVHATVTTRAGLPAYRKALEKSGLRPAPGYFALCAADQDRDSMAEVLARAVEMAKAHRELGLTEIFLADELNPARSTRAGVGADFDQARLARVSQVLGSVAEAFASHSITCCLHQHIATWVETEEEFRFILDDVGPEVLAAGPDTAHLAWAGADPVTAIRTLGRRVRAAHVKDLRTERARQLGAGLGFQRAVAEGAFTEPGRGDLDLDGCLDAIRTCGAAWVVIEVDLADGLSPEESGRRCAAWAAAREQAQSG